MRAVAIYCRISKDKEGRAEGVDVQERRSRRYVADHWPGLPVKVFIDNDLTAADPDVFRPGYQAMVDAIRRGEVAHVVCREQNRLTRQPAEWEELAVTLDRAGIQEVHTYRGGTVQVRGSKLIGRILAAVDAEEVERTRARINDKLDALAAEGRPAGGTSYGYRHDTDDHGRKVLVVDEVQAAAARWAAGAVLAGWSLTNIAKKLHDDGIPTTRGGKWAAPTVKAMLLSPTIAGLRVHRGQVVGRGNWTAILDEQTWKQVGHALRNPMTVTRSDGSEYRVSRRKSTPRKYLLTGGIGRCGKCGAPLTAQQRRGRTPGSQPSYLCDPKRGCAGIGILAEPLEDHVAKELLTELDKPEFWAAFTEDGDGDRRKALIGRLEEIEGRKAELARRWATGLSTVEWDAAREVLNAEQERVNRELNELPPPLVDIDPATLKEDWAEMTLDEKRRIVATFIEKVVVNGAKPGTRKFDGERVKVHFRGDRRP